MTTLTDSYQNRLCGAQQAQLLVPTVTLDSLTFPPPEILKIDVEGAETAVLNGARRILKEHRPIVFLALHGDRQRRECADVLYQLNYALRTLEGKEINGLPASDEIYALPPG